MLEVYKSAVGGLTSVQFFAAMWIQFMANGIWFLIFISFTFLLFIPLLTREFYCHNSAPVDVVWMFWFFEEYGINNVLTYKLNLSKPLGKMEGQDHEWSYWSGLHCSNDKRLCQMNCLVLLTDLPSQREVSKHFVHNLFI